MYILCGVRDTVVQSYRSQWYYFNACCLGYVELNGTPGLRRGELSVFTGPTGAGKTTLLSQV